MEDRGKDAGRATFEIIHIGSITRYKFYFSVYYSAYELCERNNLDVEFWDCITGVFVY